MKNKLHKNNISGHAELGSASHSVCHSVGVLINKTPTFQIPKFPNFQIFSFFFLLSSFFSNAQQYNWQWAMNGGGNLGGIDEEQIHDVKVGADGNYYFIASVYGKQNVQLNGQVLTTYNQSSGSTAKDILLFSTTCDGTVRWSRVIGGGTTDDAYNLVLDNQNNVYIGAYLKNSIITTDGSPVHFSPTDSLAYPVPNPADPYGIVPQDGYKTLFLIKYSGTGQYQGKKALQGDTGLADGLFSRILDLAIDSQNQLHFIVALSRGLHLDSQVTVPQQYGWDQPTNTNTLQYHLVRYNSSLNYVSSMVLPLSDDTLFGFGKTRFAYNETLNRYYLAGERPSESFPVTFGGDAIINKSFLLAISDSNGNEIWRREIYSVPINNNPLATNYFWSLKIDNNSDIYFGGNIYQSVNSQAPIKIYDPTDTTLSDYSFIPSASTSLPTLVKFNSSGSVQWVKQPTAFANNFSTGAFVIPKGIAINGNEVAFGSSEAYFVWDSFTQNNPQSYQPDPTLLRFNKQTGITLGMHDIKGDPSTRQSMTAVATDNDGNYITGGTFQANLFMNNTLGITTLVSTGEADFFVAKLGATPCGTPVSTDKFNKLNVNVYPNPTNDIVNIETQETLHNYEVYNVLGQQIQKGIFNSSNQINLHGAVVGTYFIKVTTTQGSTATVKVIKK